MKEKQKQKPNNIQLKLERRHWLSTLGSEQLKSRRLHTPKGLWSLRSSAASTNPPGGGLPSSLSISLFSSAPGGDGPTTQRPNWSGIFDTERLWQEEEVKKADTFINGYQSLVQFLAGCHLQLCHSVLCHFKCLDRRRDIETGVKQSPIPLL